MTAAIWCKEHAPTKTIVHRMHDIVNDDGMNALQLYVQNFKQADLALTGTVRKANLVSQSTKAVVAPPAPLNNRRVSLTAAAAANGHSRGSAAHAKEEENEIPGGGKDAPAKICVTCGSDVSPKWWALHPSPTPSAPQPQPAVSEETIEKKEPTPPNPDGPIFTKSEEGTAAPLEAVPPTVNGQASENVCPG